LVVVLFVAFFGAAFVVVRLVDLAVDLVGAFTEVLVVVVFAAGLATGLLPVFEVAAAGLVVAADASMRGLVFFAGAVARTCLMALTC
jgi:hypothetical protein